MPIGAIHNFSLSQRAVTNTNATVPTLVGSGSRDRRAVIDIHTKFKYTDGRANHAIILTAAFSSSPNGKPGKRFKMVLDTGADMTLIPQHILDLQSPCIRGERFDLAYQEKTTTDKSYMGYLSVFSGFAIFDRFYSGEGFLPSQWEYGLIGMDIIRDLVIILDFPNATILKKDRKAVTI